MMPRRLVMVVVLASTAVGCDLSIPARWPTSAQPIATSPSTGIGLSPGWTPTSASGTARSPDSAATIAATIATPTPTATMPSSQPQQPTQAPAASEDVSYIRDADLVDGTQGWVQTQGKVFWTDDGGSSWREITPPIPADAYLDWLHFFDDQRGIGLVVGKPPTAEFPTEMRIQILRTDDGGRSWGSSADWSDLTFDQEGWPRYAYALSQDRIWVSVDTTQAMNSSMGELFRTDDGGRSWSKSDLPFSGQVVFIASETGFTASSCCYGAYPQLYRTRNGGRTWEQQDLAPIPDESRWYWHDYSMPVFFGPRDGVTAVARRDADWRPTDLVLYRTRDAGAVWEEVAVFAGASESAAIDALRTPLDAASATVWGVVLGEGAAVTQDGGESFAEWPLAPMLSYVAKLLLSDGDLAWALEFHNEGLQLFRSLDAGLHWEPVAGPW